MILQQHSRFKFYLKRLVEIATNYKIRYHSSRNAGEDIVFTFDDGPMPQTSAILDLLDQYGKKATFFLLAEQVLVYPQIAKEIIKRGHEVGSHGLSHIDMQKLPLLEFFRQVNESVKIIEGVCGVKIKLFRPPFSRIGLIQSFWIMARGLVLCFWSAAVSFSGEFNSINSSFGKNRLIFLLHDNFSLEIIEKSLKKFNVPRVATGGPNHHFFGYYDKSPWDMSGRYMLAMETDFINRLPKPEDAAVIGLIDLENNNEFKPIAETRAWSWQEGCRLQWLGPDFNRYFIFNDFRGGKFVSVIFDIIQNKEAKVLSLPIYDVSPDGRCAISINFSRLDHLRNGYGYAGLKDPYYNEQAPVEDGVYSLDLNSGEYKVIITLSDLYNFKRMSSMDEGKHWVSHLMFNPSGSRFVFLHRWQLNNRRMYSRLLSANVNGSEMRVLLDSGMASHYGWRNDEEISVWGRRQSLVSEVGKKNAVIRYLLPFYKKNKFFAKFIRRKVVGDKFLLINDINSSIRPIGEGILNEDGHCSWSPDGRWMLTDTYPDEKQYRTLMLYDYGKKIKIDIAKFYSVPDKKYGLVENWNISGARCDLHPRWDRSGTQVCVDSVHKGSRQMYILDVEELLG